MTKAIKLSSQYPHRQTHILDRPLYLDHLTSQWKTKLRIQKNSIHKYYYS